ncbi:transcriptional regulator [Nocardioidaceae bacterium SCSIO 66511]|nr:transcriptional regulator [Nocardioidaceae bacterium SCSIO 66511]
MEYAKALGSRLRAIRQQQGLSLQGVEQKSGGRWKAVVIGSYERGDRAVTVQRLSELADFYGVPIEHFLPEVDENQHGSPDGASRLVIDLERLKEIRAVEGAPLARYISTIQSQRGDYNGRVLSIREDDLRNLSIIYDEDPDDLARKFTDWGVVRPSE